jgi:hypothetical protein
MASRCARCGSNLEILKHPVRRLRGTGFQWRGFLSLFGEPFRSCARCGAIYAADGSLLAAGVVETAHELSVRAYRDDMANIRDAFAAVTIAAELGVAWMWFGSAAHVQILTPILAGLIGVLAVPPFVFFARLARQATTELDALRTARLRGRDTPDVPLVSSSTRD